MSDNDQHNGGPGGHARWSDDAGAYVLGALDAAEATAFEHHLKTCAACREELAALEPIVALLPLAAQQYEVPEALRGRVLDRADAETRGPGRRASGATSAGARSRWRARTVLAGAALAVAAAAVLAVAALRPSAAPGPRVYHATVGDAKLYVSAGGSKLFVRRLRLRRSGDVYEVWLLRPRRAPSPSGLFGVDSTGAARVALPGALRGVSAVAVTEEPAGGTLSPTRKPVIVTPVT